MYACRLLVSIVVFITSNVILFQIIFVHVLSSHRFSSEASFENAIMMPTGKQIDSDYMSMMCLLYDGDIPDTSSLASTDTSAR